MANLIIKLLSRACFTETSLALKNGAVPQKGFAILEQVAAKNLFSDQSVVAGLAGLETYIIAEDLENHLESGQ